MKSNATAREEEVRRFPDRYIASVKTPDGRLLRSGREIRDAFRAHFRDRFARCTDLPLREFCSYLADFPRLGAAEAASCEGVVTECEVRDALKQVGLNKSLGLDGLPYDVYLRMSHMFVPILTDMFNHWFAQGAIPGSVTKGVITLLKKGGRHVWEGLDDYRPITLLNTELKILARVLANRLQLVISDLIGSEQTFTVKGRSIQDNLHLIREVLEGIKDDTESALISLDQSKAFDRVDHRFLASVLETAGFKPEFRRWIAERLAYLGRVLTGDSVWRRKASRTFPRLKSDPKAEGRRKPLGEALFVCECRKALRNLLGSSDLSWPRKELYRELVVGSASDPLSVRHGWTAEEIRSHWNWAPGSSFLNNSEFSLTWRLVRNALSLRGLNFKAGLADMPDCPRCGSGLEETAEHAFYYCESVRFGITSGSGRLDIEPKQLVLLDVGYVVDNVFPPFHGEKRVVFLAILAVARMVIWTTRNKGLYDDANFSHRDLVLYFRHQLRVKIRCDRKRLDRITFNKRWVTAVSLVVRKGATLESSFPPLPAHGVYGTGP